MRAKTQLISSVTDAYRAGQLRRWLDTGICVSTLVLAYLMTAGAAQAQQGDQASASTDAPQEIVVYGYRASLEAALDKKRLSDLPIESVAAEDIGKMPDQNVAESLQRLPGVQIDRSGGQGTSVLIDGLRQNLTTLNGDVFLTGREFYVSGVLASGGGGSTAQYGSLESIPSEEIGGIDVYKNPKATLTEGGLGGIIDLRSRDPLAGPEGPSMGGNFRMSNAEGTPQWTPNGTLVTTYKFNDRFAVTGSVSYDKEDTHTKQATESDANWIITNAASFPSNAPLTTAQLTTLPSSAGNGGNYLEPMRFSFLDNYIEQKTTGASLGVAAKISDSLKTDVLWFYSHEEAVTTSYSADAMFNGAANGPGTLFASIDPTKPYNISANGVVQNATFVATGASTHTFYQDSISNANNVQWRTSYSPVEYLRATLDASYALATSNLQADQADIVHSAYATGGSVVNSTNTGFTSGVLTSPAAPGCNNYSSTCSPGTGNAPYEFTWTNGGKSGLPTISNLSSILNNPAYSTFQSNWAWANLTSQRQSAIKLDVAYDPTLINGVDSTLTVGARYATRSVGQTYGSYLINGTLPDGQIAGADGTSNTGPYDYYLDPGIGIPGVNVNIPYSTAVSNPGLASTATNFATGNILVKNPRAGGMTNPSTFLNTVWSQAGVGGVPNNTEALFADSLSSFGVHESTTSGYLMADLGGPANRFHANFGVRIVRTDLTINNAQTAPVPTTYGTDFWNGVNSNNVPITTNRSYTDVLPSLNLVLDVSDTEKVRIGAARVVAPQDLFSLGLGNSYQFGRVTGNPALVNIHTGKEDGFQFQGGTSGNTQLDPYRATQGNLSYENYFTKGAIVSVGGFWKSISNFVETQNTPTFVADDFGGSTADVVKPQNAGSGRIYGVELGGQYAFDGRIIPWLDGFGVAANYTLSESTSRQATSFTTRSGIPGVSKDSITATFYYEKNGFSARASYSWRDQAVSDGALGSTWALHNQNNVSVVYQIFSAPYGQLDGQISYDFNTHCGIVFSAQNLTDAAQHTYLQFPDQPFTYEAAGRRFFLGGKFKL